MENEFTPEGAKQILTALDQLKATIQRAIDSKSEHARELAAVNACIEQRLTNIENILSKAVKH